MKYAFVDHDGRFFFEADERVIVNLETSAKKYMSENEATLLACLIEGRRSKSKLMNAVWLDRGIVVANSSYYQLVMQLRKSFEEIGLPKHAIKTIPRYGLELAVSLLPESAIAHEPHTASDGTVASPLVALQGKEPLRSGTSEHGENGHRGVLARFLRGFHPLSASRVGLFLTGLLAPARS
jgi:DNA-binding winged helix-turn-helix (wHTH) protein